jgi:hypothetical protein
VRAPSDDAAGGEGRGEQLTRDAALLHDHACVVLDVGVEITPGLQLGEHPLHRLLDLHREVDARATERARDVAQHHRARIGGLVDRVPEAHDPIAGSDRVAHPALGPLR